jgi:ABC-2 type transport system ATP-binding protein
MSHASVIAATGLVKSYGTAEAVRGVDLDVAPGEVFGFLGPNGAGKTTTIEVLWTLTAPTAGQAYVGGIDVARNPEQARANIGIVFRHPLNPAAYGIDALRRVALDEVGLPPGSVDRLAMTIGDAIVPIVTDRLILIVFGALALVIAARGFADPD